MLVAKAISKRFGRTVALDGVGFEARGGEIHALLGENGAGKTTLMNVFAGTMRPDAGTVTLDDVAIRPGSPQAALKAGVAAVHQSPMLFERFTWEENLALGGFVTGPRRLGLHEIVARARQLAETIGFKLPPAGARVEQRSVAERVRLEVLRALSFNPRVLILDEPTGVLPPNELEPFLDSLRRLRAEGRIVLLVTHKLGEALAVADRITVLRRGKVIATTTPEATSEAALARLMVGEIAAAEEVASRARIPGEPALEIDALTLVEDGRPVLDGVSLAARRSEIVGIAGVDGNGQEQLVAILAGARRQTSGRVRIRDRATMAVIPQNRDVDGLILDMAVWENLLLAAAVRKSLASRGWIDKARALALCRDLLARFRIRAEDPEMKAAALSGGNRQRLEIARAFASHPQLIVAHDPTRGLDLAATAEVQRTLSGFAAQGGAVLLISTDLDELLRLCDRIAVISGGRLREASPNERTPERLGLMMAGAL